MARPLQVLVTIPHLRAGGALTSFAVAARLARDAGIAVRHRILALEPAVSPLARIALTRAGVAIDADPSPAKETDALAWADVVLFVFWNTPHALAFIERLPSSVPLVAWTTIAGTAPPQVVPPTLLRRADRLVVSCAATLGASPLADDPEQARRAVVIRSLPDPASLGPVAPVLHDGFVVGYVGTIGPGKLHPTFVDLSLSARIDDARFLVCGSGGGEAALRHAIAARGAENRFDLRGFVRDVRGALATMDVFGYPLAPDTYAASCLSLQEAMSAGVPPVILGHGGNPEMVRNGETGLVVDEAHYGAALAHLRHHPEERARLGANAARESAASLDGRRSALRLHALLAEASALGWTSPHRAEHAAGPFAAAQRFADALGGWGDAFRRSLQGDRRADDAIRATSIDAARTEGGLFHHRNAEPDDGVLRYWAALVLEGHGRMDAARAEFAAARALGAPGEDPVTGLAPHGRIA